MSDEETTYGLRLARDELDLLGAQRLRYRVFVQELGATGPLVDHARQLERDDFDPLFDHLLLIDKTVPPETLDHVIGAYRLLPCNKLPPGGRYYSEDEFDLSALKSSGRRLLELGRTCVHPDHRGGAAMFLLWNGLSDYVSEREIEVLFGPASFHGTDLVALAEPLAWLYHHHLSPPAIRVQALPPGRAEMDLFPADKMERARAMALMPALIKAYLRLGGTVGEGAYIDRAFNTTDVCLVMDTSRMSAKHRDFYARKKGPG